MNIQPISNQQTYKGKIVFVDKLNTSCDKKISTLLEGNIKNELSDISAIMSDKSYDLFVYRNREYPGYITVGAGTLFNKLLKYPPERQVNVADDCLSQFKNAVKSAMQIYENSISKKQIDERNRFKHDYVFSELV